VKNGRHPIATPKPLAEETPAFGLRSPPAGIDLTSVLRAYRRYAPAYDVLFGPVFQRGRLATAARVNQLGRIRVLEVGVGTGLSLTRYSDAEEIVGVDVSSEMLAIAQRRVEKKRLSDRVSLVEMDGEHLAFPDHQFDVVVAMYVVSVTPNPRRCLAEMRRVCKPGGQIFICNHFVHDGERALSPGLQSLSRWLGWRPDFGLPELLDGSPLEIDWIQPVSPFGFFRLVALRRT
jgi:phosphatidylethanolamine/phosphatidyl-N-methylethanolamine N-methyltransferase